MYSCVLTTLKTDCRLVLPRRIKLYRDTVPSSSFGMPACDVWEGTESKKDGSTLDA